MLVWTSIDGLEQLKGINWCWETVSLKDETEYLDQVVENGNKAFFQQKMMCLAIRELTALALTTAPKSAVMLRTVLAGPSP